MKLILKLVTFIFESIIVLLPFFQLFIKSFILVNDFAFDACHFTIKVFLSSAKETFWAGTVSATLSVCFLLAAMFNTVYVSHLKANWPVKTMFCNSAYSLNFALFYRTLLNKLHMENNFINCWMQNFACKSLIMLFTKR